MLGQVREDVTRNLSLAQFQLQPPPQQPQMPSFVTTHMDPFTGENDAASPPPLRFDAFGSTLPSGALAAAQAATAVLEDVPEEDLAEWRASVSRNADCPCGSGRKFKHCHGAL
jgi:preprotein translocase subunit SecA